MITVLCEDLTTSTLCRRVTPQLCTQVQMRIVSCEAHARDRTPTKMFMQPIACAGIQLMGLHEAWKRCHGKCRAGA